MASLSSDNAVDVAGVSKRFRFPSVSKQATLKDLVVRRVRHEGRFNVVDALQDVTFSVRRGQTLGVIGENGSGKTTLLRILCGITRADRGEARLRGTVAPLLALGTGFNPYLTGRENALIELLTLGMGRREARRQLDDVIAFSELGEFVDAPMRTYSTGMTMRLAFAAATRIDPDILLIDEVLAVGDERFAAKCAAWLDDFRSRGKTTLLVTHNSHAVAAQCDVALWLDNGRVAAFGGAVDVVRAYTQAKSGKPVAETIAPAAQTLESAKELANTYRERLAGLLPLLRVPLIGYVRQEGTIKGGYEDGWTDGALEFAVVPLRDVRHWAIRATVPAGMTAETTVDVHVDGTPVATAPAASTELVLHCDVPLAAGAKVTIRVLSSSTVNHHALGISGDLRDVGPRVDEIVFEH
ncbi:MAG TPA: ATP-binding cassette domain-containing protein [Candidatus Baltobacteraceae bacterium]|nr:ATP-binding cassette domain-containing protein [Candidatus Baltobacteraceae bacterium]